MLLLKGKKKKIQTSKFKTKPVADGHQHASDPPSHRREDTRLSSHQSHQASLQRPLVLVNDCVSSHLNINIYGWIQWNCKSQKRKKLIWPSVENALAFYKSESSNNKPHLEFYYIVV